VTRGRPGCRGSGSERGSASLVAVAILIVVMMMALGTADLARILVAAGKAQTAADAAALAAAQELALPSGAQPAEMAAEYATRNGAAIRSCDCPEGSLEARVGVVVDAGPLLLLGGSRQVIAEARAVVDLPAG
jgi:secretion/DNA translocation related TadE-like protein